MTGKNLFKRGTGGCDMHEVFEKIIEKLEELHERYINQYGAVGGNPMAFSVKECMEIVQEVAEEYNGGWIPIKTRPMTEEEKEYYSEYLFEGNGLIYECPLPEDGQEVLVTSKYGSVDKTTFYTDCGNYFENYEDYDEVIAWQPLPQPYKESE